MVFFFSPNFGNANPKEGIYSQQDDSRAIRLGGFMNIPMDRFGIQSPVIIEAVAEIVLADLLHCHYFTVRTQSFPGFMEIFVR